MGPRGGGLIQPPLFSLSCNRKNYIDVVFFYCLTFQVITPRSFWYLICVSLEPTNGSAKGIIQMRELRKLEVGNYVENESTSQMEGHGTRAYIRPKQESSAISLVAKPSDNVILPEEDPNQDPKNL